MTHRELLRFTGPAIAQLTPIERQKRYLLTQALARSTCPSCGRWCTLLEACGVDLDQWDFTLTNDQRTYKCPTCGRELLYTLPLMIQGGFPGWHWTLKPITHQERAS